MTAVAEMTLPFDALLPQRDFLLDAAEAARRFSAQLGARGPLKVDRCERLRAKYRFGESLRVLYGLQIEGATHHVAARAFADGRGQEVYRRASRGALPCGALRPVFYDADLDAVFWTFPNDRKMTNLRVLLSPQGSLSHHLGSRWTRSRLVAFAPEKCATAQCLDDDLNALAYAKLYAGDEGRRTCLTYRALRQSLRRGDSGLRLPQALAYSEEHRTLLLEPVGGTRVADLRGADAPEGFRRLGAALAALHDLPPHDGLPPFTRLDASRLQHAARIVEVARPELGRLVKRLALELCSRRGAAGDLGQLVCLHGDVHPKNAVLRGDALTLIDLDQSGVGTAAADLGSLLAALSYNRLVGLLSPARERELADAFLAGYAATRALPSDASLRWHTAAALLAERALRAVNRIRPEGLQHLDEILIEAERLLRRRA